ncbi:mitochondrial ribosomal death-associated protein 3-domain-containing protein [Crucibulum laeve]|uniref:Small ribosomal subunit protein mS29 n=1 Tax=Crucibulum laeve TaxID=68775 RepID=A0A5C3M330_9AGAR|nr:mitochondrial ribosomal death-associated protein 3-domain-containing protein [Crucibulum laeve]
MEYCKENGCIVLYIPRATNLVNSITPYVYDLRTQIYSQPTFAYQTLQRMLTVNRPTLDALELLTALVLEKQTVPAGTTLSALINIALKDKLKASCMMILETLLKELGEQTKYPVLVAVDEFQGLYNKTMYRDPHFNTIAPYHLSMPRLLMEYASSQPSFTKDAYPRRSERFRHVSCAS